MEIILSVHIWLIELEHIIFCFVLVQLIDINDPKYFCVQDGKKRRLRVSNISGKDEGLYKCKVQNKVTSGKLYVARK